MVVRGRRHHPLTIGVEAAIHRGGASGFEWKFARVAR
jgi:hypothetical protein